MPNLLLERTEVEQLIIDFDIDQSIPEEEGDLPEICVQQGIDASAKKSGGRAKGSKKAKKPPKPKKNKTSAPKKPKQAKTNTPKAPTMSRGEQLRKKHGSAAAGYAAYRDKNVGSKKFKAGAQGVSRTQSSGAKKSNGAISRSQFMTGAIEKSINRKARKTGKSITATRKVNTSPDGYAPDIKSHTFRGDPTRGGTRKPARKPVKSTASKGTKKKKKSMSVAEITTLLD